MPFDQFTFCALLNTPTLNSPEHIGVSVVALFFQFFSIMTVLTLDMFMLPSAVVQLRDCLQGDQRLPLFVRYSSRLYLFVGGPQ